MRWLNPVALVGMLALAVPILVHLFGRRTARRQPFPSLRLLREGRPTPATRSQPSDVLLLLLRCGVIAAAALALAQPLWMSAARSRRATTPARAIIVDTSASMLRLTSGGQRALEQARDLARRMVDSSREAMVLETGRPGVIIAGAASWLERRSGLREVVIVSDFQEGAVQDGDLDALLPGIGLRPLRVSPVVAPSDTSPRSGDGMRVEALTRSTGVTWDMAPADSLNFPVRVVPAPDADEAVRATVAAVRQLQPGVRATHEITVVFSGNDTGSVRIAERPVLAAPWQGDLLVSLRRNHLLAGAVPSEAPSCDTRGTAVIHNERRQPLAVLAPGVGGDLVIYSCVAAGSSAAAALLSAVVSGVSQAPALDELEPSVVPDETLRLWERSATRLAPRGRDDTSPDGRWLWLAAILLLVIEERVRRRRPQQRAAATAPASSLPDERVA